MQKICSKNHENMQKSFIYLKFTIQLIIINYLKRYLIKKNLGNFLKNLIYLFIIKMNNHVRSTSTEVIGAYLKQPSIVGS